jgi:hypothetical protein
MSGPERRALSVFAEVEADAGAGISESGVAIA